MSYTVRRSAIGVALLAVLGAGAGVAIEAHHTAPMSAGVAHQHSAPAHQNAAAAHPVSQIPQGNGGDHDGDNNGGPSDGDGTL